VHRLTTTFVLGYHGCDAEVARRIVAGERFRPSENRYDWLGSGIYFWEANPRRGLDFAREVMKRQGARSAMETPAVIGAVIDLRLCLDLSTSAGTDEVRQAYDSFEAAVSASGSILPKNERGNDLYLRNLDRAVIEHLHAVRRDMNLPEIDTVRGFFFEGKQLYPGGGFFEKTHVQLCVRNIACIHGVFNVPAADLEAT
jgi:hypothetical protein